MRSSRKGVRGTTRHHSATLSNYIENRTTNGVVLLSAAGGLSSTSVCSCRRVPPKRCRRAPRCSVGATAVSREVLRGGRRSEAPRLWWSAAPPQLERDPLGGVGRSQWQTTRLRSPFGGYGVTLTSYAHTGSRLTVSNKAPSERTARSPLGCLPGRMSSQLRSTGAAAIRCGFRRYQASALPSNAEAAWSAGACSSRSSTCSFAGMSTCGSGL